MTIVNVDLILSKFIISYFYKFHNLVVKYI